MEPCTSDNFDPNCPVIDPEIISIEEESAHSYPYIQIRNLPTGPFLLWLVAPMMHVVAGGVAFYDTKAASSIWMGVNIFNIFVGYLSVLWFHEYYVGGRTEPDSMFSNWNGISSSLWYLTAGLSGYATYASTTESNQYPIATTANVLSVLFGLWFSGKT